MRTLSSTFARMIALSLVFVATTAFVLQGASAQGHNHATAHYHAKSGGAAAHSHDHDHHDSGVGAEHTHEDAAPGHTVTGDPEPSMAGFDDSGSCCGKFCSSVLCVSPPSLATMKRRPGPSAIIRSQVPDGIGPSGLKRPPRTISMT
jgi:hypothetical protein